MLENYYENKLRTGVKKLGGGAMCLKFVSPGFTGVPDRLILLPGAKLLFVEMKRSGKTERERQKYVQMLLRKLGFEVFNSVDSQEKIDEVINRCRELMA